MGGSLYGFFKPEHSKFNGKACSVKKGSKRSIRQKAKAREKKEAIELEILREANKRI